MRAGVFVAYWPWFTPDEQVRLAVLADELGLDSVWVAEAWGQDAVSVLGYLAARTERVALGSALMQIPARPPAGTAMAAATLDVLSGGRLRLGLGVSGPQVSEGWYAVPFARPLSRTREYVEIVRAALERRGPLEYAGREYRIPMEGGTGLGKPLKLLARPVQERIPIYLGAIGPKSVEQAGRIADGWIPFMFDPAQADEQLAPLLRGIEAAGRARGDVDVAVSVPVALDDDVGAARAAVRPIIAFYLGAMGAPGRNFYVDHAERIGFGDAARRVQELWLARDRGGAMAALPDAVVDTMAIACPPSALDDRLAAFEAAGVDTLVAVPLGADREGVVRALAAATAGTTARA